ncbi:hypothetical protein Mpsy_1744 [Methanolobus psychrophilus R15]|nr:hypothetical protein Mpsy_1744 [Methanolobus psychrophilus R15]
MDLNLVQVSPAEMLVRSTVTKLTVSLSGSILNRFTPEHTENLLS